MKRLAIALSALILVGCAPQQPVTNTVETAVTVFCTPEPVQVPVFPSDNFTGAEDDHQVTKGLWASVELYEAYVIRLRASVDSCRKK
jgi:PBP1b-binding outer membrane lipoprotein LpoB